ncbi:uncharacterized protein N7496_007215 [Penicillium cataractarum]|uniref:Uncharacterized protein n=1 Tax=Penicillium cataractarum TaxID=2100454 RepID=A0A9W9V6W2_9EURO|nr:uncharacterized protein N7496_007215 [Penicillium cataractarum]KAJ5371123.1 hypothetical protein N7496_007215 [Penicillium cataractarum]
MVLKDATRDIRFLRLCIKSQEKANGHIHFNVDEEETRNRWGLMNAALQKEEDEMMAQLATLAVPRSID